jgi:hypothetical protein
MAFQLICGNFTLLFSEEYLSSAKGNDTVGTWLSLVEHSVRDAGVAGSNPVVPTMSYAIFFKN